MGATTICYIIVFLYLTTIMSMLSNILEGGTV